MLIETTGEFLFLHAMRKCFDRHAAKLAARRYIAEHFHPSHKQHSRSIYSLKHDFECATDRYITADDYAECLRRCGLPVVDGKVFASEAPCS